IRDRQSHQPQAALRRATGGGRPGGEDPQRRSLGGGGFPDGDSYPRPASPAASGNVLHGCERAPASLWRNSDPCPRPGRDGAGTPDGRILRSRSDWTGGGDVHSDRAPVVQTLNRLSQLGVSEAVALLRGREISAQELTRACLERVAERDPQV